MRKCLRLSSYSAVRSAAQAPVALLVLSVLFSGPLSASEINAKRSASFAGEWGMRLNLNDLSGVAYVEDQFTTASAYRGRIYLRVDEAVSSRCPSGFTLPIMRVGDASMSYSVEVGVLDSSGVKKLYLDTPSSSPAIEFDITLGAWQAVELAWESDATSSRTTLTLVGVQSTMDTDLGNLSKSVELVRLGDVDASHNCSGGFVDFDEYAGTAGASIPLITDELLAPPKLLAPKGSVDDNPPTFTWAPVPGAQSYELRVFNTTQGGTDVYIGEVTSTSFQLPQPIAVADTHSWRVRTRSTAGYGQLSSGQSFWIPRTVPLPIAPIGPTTEVLPTFSWSEIADAIGYELQVFDGVNLLFGQTTATTFYQSTVPIEQSHSYTWQVRTQFPSSFSDWSPPTPFSLACSTDPVIFADVVEENDDFSDWTAVVE